MPRIRIRLTSYAVAVSIGLVGVVFGLVAVDALVLEQLSIGGPVYQQLVTGKDLVADILPPPEYVIEAYLDATLVLNDPPAAATYRDRLAHLEDQYRLRRAYWTQKREFAPDIIDELTRRSDEQVSRFWAALDTDFLPAIDRGDMAQARRAYDVMSEAYRQHRTVIDSVVAHTTLLNEKIEAGAAKSEARLRLVRLLIATAALALIALALTLLVRLVVRPLARMGRLLGRMAEGQLDVMVPDTRRCDEVGMMARALNVFREHALTIREFEARERQRIKEDADQTLRRTETRYQALIEHSGDMIAAFRPDGSFIHRNATWIAATVDTDPAVQGAVFRQFHPDDAEDIHQAVTGIMAEPGDTAAGRARLHRRDGSRCLVAWTVRNATEVDGLNGIVMNARDITLEDSLQEELQQTRKLEAMGQLAGGIAHDFNNIMGAILGFAGFLIEDLPPQSQQHEFAQRIVAAGNHARDLVAQIRTFARKSSVSRVQTDLASIVQEAAEFLRVSLPTSTELKVTARDGPLLAEVNPTQISQVIVNLGVNASDAMHGAPGRVAIGLSAVRWPDPQEIGLVEKGNRPDEGVLISGQLVPDRHYARLTVLDSGSGMPAEVLRRIFDPFFTTKARDRGTGLGLAVVHGIISDYDGACIVESKPGSGTVFRIYLPIAAGEIRAAATTHGGLLGGTERLLVVDDEAFLTEMLHIGLGRLGYEVITSNDPVHALSMVETDPQGFDAVVSDQAMPNMTGLMLTQRIKAIRPSMPVILCSGFSDNISEENVIAAGAVTLLHKPLPLEDLAVQLRAVLDAA